MEILPELYPLTSLQIGDIQSYISRAFLYFSPKSNRLLILVDNRPWLMDKHSKSAKIWQLMVSKYRMSPFVNKRALQNALDINRKKIEMNGDLKPSQNKSKRFNQWFSVIGSVKWKEKYLPNLMELSKALHGFIVFEVAWKDVHGINYLNELQTDTILALEVKSMKKWEFFSPDQASTCISSWFNGEKTEVKLIQKNLKLLSDFDLQHWNSHPSSLLSRRPSPLEVLPDDNFLDVQEFLVGTDDEINLPKNIKDSDKISILKCREIEESNGAPIQYADTLILIRFSDCILPTKLRQIMISDLRLLTLVEAGLPSWVIFFQSYPFFCHFYRPWMRYLARTLYILISLVTVIIGFYDLYKNVPLLKATVARLSGPLFRWIEGWEMITRVHYLGAMLFLQNLKKGFKWIMIISRTARVVLSTITKPLAGPLYGLAEFLFPIWNACRRIVNMFSSTVWLAIASMHGVFLDLFEILTWPFELLYSYIWSTASSIYPMMCSICDLLLVPVRCALALANYMSSLLSNAFVLIKNIWQSLSSIFKIIIVPEMKQGAYDISIWKGLWNDLFSQVFRATRSIINGLLAFFMTCNRHRVSTYNHMQAFLRRLAHTTNTCPCQQMPHLEHPHKEADKECDHCE